MAIFKPHIVLYIIIIVIMAFDHHIFQPRLLLKISNDEMIPLHCSQKQNKKINKLSISKIIKLSFNLPVLLGKKLMDFAAVG